MRLKLMRAQKSCWMAAAKSVGGLCVCCERSKSGRSKLSVNMVVMRPTKWRAGTT